MRQERATEPDYPSPMLANYALGIMTVAYVFSFIDRQILSLLVAPIRRDLDISDFEISLLQGLAFALFYTVLGLPLGRLADRHNRKLIIAGGVFVWSLMTAACGLARSFPSLFLARIGVGVGEAALSPAAFSILSDYFAPGRAARAMAIYTLGSTFGAGLAFVIGGAVVDLVSTAEPVLLPAVGTIMPWQITFFVVGLPGLILVPLILLIREPHRRGLLRNTELAGSAVPLGAVLRYVGRRWRLYGSIYGGVGMLAVIGYGTMAWYPSFLMRRFGMSAGDVGLSFGVLFMSFGTIGALGSAFLSERLYAAGHVDANIRVAVLVAFGMLVPAALGPLMPTAALALVAAAPMVLFINAHAGITTAALQLVTPNQMRATVTAGMYFVSNLVGMGLGPTMVAALTDFVFGRDDALGYSLVIVGGVACPVAGVLFIVALRHYRRAVEELARGAGER